VSALIAALALTACSSSSKQSSSTSAPPRKGSARLSGVPQGSAQLLAGSGQTRIRNTGYGFAPGSQVRAEVHAGSCVKPSDNIRVRFLPAKVGRNGRLAAASSPAGSAASVTAPGYIALFPAGTHTRNAQTVIACGDLNGRNPTALIGMFPPPGRRASGDAALTVDDGAQTVATSLDVSKLAPSHSFLVALRDGKCVAEGQNAYPVGSVESDAHGSARAQLSAQKISAVVPASAWSLLLIDGQKADDPPVACGDVSLTAPPTTTTPSTS
jgi:hypothetical protein